MHENLSVCQEFHVLNLVWLDIALLSTVILSDRGVKQKGFNSDPSESVNPTFIG
jgi:hypothetical protein